MEFSFTEEQEQFRDSAHRFLKRHSPTTEVRRLMQTDAGFDPAVWRQLSLELGLTAISIPESHGGGGFSAVELGILMEECGRTLLCAPYFSSAVLATRAIVHAGTESEHETLLPSLASGNRRAAFALTEPDGQTDLAAISLTVTGTEHRLSGTKAFVIDGHSADLLIVAARSPAGIGLYTLDAHTPGVSTRLCASMDPTRKLAEIRFENAPSTPLGDPGAATEQALRSTLDDAWIALAHEMVGGAQALLESALAYAATRVQFGRTIGSFQAIKHKCADMLLDVESAKSAAYYAAQAVAADDVEAPALACLAKATAADAYLRTAAQTIQIHGGIGFTWENDTHLWFKRAKSSEVLLGTPDYHRELLMQRWGY